MSDFGFEARLERLFAQPPRLADAGLFARRLQERLEREWALRRGLLGAAGVVGGFIAVTQTVGAEVYGRLLAAAGPTGRQIEAAWLQSQADVAAGGLPMSNETLWLVAGVAAGLGAVLAATRLADTF